MNTFEQLIYKLPSWLRWILVLPLSLILAYVVWFVFFNLTIITLPVKNSSLVLSNLTLLDFAQILSNGVFCLCLLYFSYVIAPNYKKVVLVTFAILSTLFICIPAFVGVIQGDYPIFGKVVLSDIIYIVTSIFACCKIPSEMK